MSEAEKIVELEGRLWQNDVRLFVEAVQRDDADTIILSFASFRGKPDLLHIALEYASYYGRTVLVVPLLEEDLEK